MKHLFLGVTFLAFAFTGSAEASFNYDVFDSAMTPTQAAEAYRGLGGQAGAGTPLYTLYKRVEAMEPTNPQYTVLQAGNLPLAGAGVARNNFDWDGAAVTANSWTDGSAFFAAVGGATTPGVQGDYALPVIAPGSINDTPAKRTECTLRLAFLRLYFGYNPAGGGGNSDIVNAAALRTNLSPIMSDGLANDRYTAGPAAQDADNAIEDFKKFNVQYMAAALMSINIDSFN